VCAYDVLVLQSGVHSDLLIHLNKLCVCACVCVCVCVRVCVRMCIVCECQATGETQLPNLSSSPAPGISHSYFLFSVTKNTVLRAPLSSTLQKTRSFTHSYVQRYKKHGHSRTPMFSNTRHTVIHAPLSRLGRSSGTPSTPQALV
jgi:hypothetical protein